MKKSKTEGVNNGTPSSPGLKRANEQPPQQEPPPPSARRTSSQLEGNDYKSKRAGEFMPSMVIPGVKFPGAPPQSSPNVNRQRSKSADPSRKELTSRRTIPNAGVPKKVENQPSDTLRAVTFGPTDIHKGDNIKANITVFGKPKPGTGASGQSRPDQNTRRASAEKEKRASGKGQSGFYLTPAPDHQRQRHSLNASHTNQNRPHEHQGSRSSAGADDRMKGNGEPQAKGGGWGWSAGRKSPEKINIPTDVTIETKHHYIGPQAVIKPEPQHKSANELAAAQAEQRKLIREIGIKLGADQNPKTTTNQNDRGKLVIDKPAKETGGSGAPDPVPLSHPKEKTSEKLAMPDTGKSYESVDLWWRPSGGDAPKDGQGQPSAGAGNVAPTKAQAPRSPQPPPSENARAQEKQQPRPVSPTTEMLFTPKTQPSRSRRVIQNTSQQRAPVQQTSGKRIVTETYQPADTSVDNIKIQISVAKALPKPVQVIRPPPPQQPLPPAPKEPKAPPPPPPQPRPKSAEPIAEQKAPPSHQPPPSENSRAQEKQQPRPVSPTTEMLLTPKTQPSRGRRVIQNTSQQRAPVQQTSGKRIVTETYQPAETSVDNIKIQISVAKALPKPAQVIRPPPPQQPPPPPPEEAKAPPPPPPQPRPKSAEPIAPPKITAPPPEQKAPPRAKSEPRIPPPPPPPPPQPKPVKSKVSLRPPTIQPRKQTLEEPELDDKERNNSNALLDYLSTIAKLSNEELEHDGIPSPEFADDNIQLIEILKKFEIPDQQRALDSLLDTDSVHFNFGGLMREYYSYMLRSYAPINMQDRYRSVSSPAHCFTSVDLSKIGTREQEMEKVTQAKLRKLDEKREQLRNVATDEDHFKFLKNLANDQSTLLPLTLVHMLNEQMAPIMEDVFRFYGKNLGTEHKSTKEAGFHYMKIRKRCEMYTHICGGSTINEDLAPFYK